jgi:hypothetical protein
MGKRIISVEGKVPAGTEVESVDFKSNYSILDADIVIFSPSFKDYQTDGNYAGQALLSQEDSAELRQHTVHWKSELSLTLEHGKTVFVLLPDLGDFHIHSGQRNVSGTGRSAIVTNLVHPYDPYSSIPLEGVGTIHRSNGNRIKPTDKLGVLSSYWKIFGEYSYYEVYLDNLTIEALLTQTGDKVVGGLIRSKSWKGTIVLLPLVDFDLMIHEQQKQIQAKKKVSAKKKAERIVGRQFIAALVQIDKTIRVSLERTPEPQWSTEPEFSLQEELKLAEEIIDIEKQIAELHHYRKDAQEKLEAAANLRGLLYETGKPLESAILEALRLLEFRAENYKDPESEFDVLFVDPEGAGLLGEAEGKNDKAINIDKLDQLNRNVQEEFAKRPDTKHSKGVLFGNAFRLTPLNDRGQFFTDKCMAGAARLGFALLRTPDLFHVAKYLKESRDPEFARKCRAEIVNTSGKVVVFPSIPATEA